jgi:uncharacterized protein YndB with AHSA1/START domain
MKPMVDISRRYYCSQDKLWNAIAEGVLFMYTGAIKEKARIEFKTGGKIHLEWNDSTISMDGEFLEITPQSQIRLTWNTSAGVNSKVALQIKSVDAYCELNLHHEFPEGTDTMAYDWGWDDSLFDLKKFLYK